MFKLLSMAAAAAAFALSLSPGPAFAQTTSSMPMPAAASNQGPNGYGKTNDYESGYTLEDVYSHGYYCDTSIAAKSSTGCEVGAAFKRPPSNNYDPLYITVPLGFTAPTMYMQCPTALTCIDHPATIDLSLIGGPANAMTPGHNHFTTTTNGYQPEWWNVYVIGVTSSKTWSLIDENRNFNYIKILYAKGDKTVTQPIPTNLFLYFAVTPPPKP